MGLRNVCIYLVCVTTEHGFAVNGADSSTTTNVKGTPMSDTRNPKAGLEALLTPDNCVLILIDHQPFQVAGLRSIDTASMINNVVGLAKSAKVFGVPTLLTTVLERQGGYIIKPLQEVLISGSMSGGAAPRDWR